MKTAVLTRTESSDEGTFGIMTFGGNTVFTVELPWRDNAKRVSCIPEAIYVCRMVRSPKFGNIYGVMDVVDRANVLIHSANLAGDESLGYTTQLRGCIAPCLRLGKLRNKAGNLQKAGLVSRPALSKLMEWASGEPFKLEIKCLHQ